jgi:hypothetical protein
VYLDYNPLPLPFFGAESPYIVDVATPLWALQPFRVGDEGDALKIEAKINTTFCGIKHK